MELWDKHGTTIISEVSTVHWAHRYLQSHDTTGNTVHLRARSQVVRAIPFRTVGREAASETRCTKLCSIRHQYGISRGAWKWSCEERNVRGNTGQESVSEADTKHTGSSTMRSLIKPEWCLDNAVDKRPGQSHAISSANKIILCDWRCFAWLYRIHPGLANKIVEEMSKNASSGTHNVVKRLTLCKHFSLRIIKRNERSYKNTTAASSFE